MDIADRIAVEELLYRYVAAMDNGAGVEELLGLFTSDALLVSSIVGDFSGTEGIVEFWKSSREVLSGSKARHYVTNVTVSEKTQGQACVSAYFCERISGLITGADDSSARWIYGRYTCDAVKCDSGWKIRRRVVETD
jgi:ketosteroid isomerase-like protein